MVKSNKISGLAIAGLVIAAGAGAVLDHSFMPRTVEKRVEVSVENPLNEGLQKDLSLAQAEIVRLKALPPTVKTETQTVYQDNGKLDEVIKAVFDAKGNVEFATDDLDDSEISKLADRLVAANDFRARAEAKVREEAFRELHKDNSTGVKLDKEDMRSLSIDYDEESIDFADFDSGDVDVLVPIHFKQDGDKFDATLIVRFNEGVFDSLDVDSVTKL